jgi:hypothetical protein
MLDESFSEIYFLKEDGGFVNRGIAEKNGGFSGFERHGRVKNPPIGLPLASGCFNRSLLQLESYTGVKKRTFDVGCSALCLFACLVGVQP